jgi:hypothetical protein
VGEVDKWGKILKVPAPRKHMVMCGVDLCCNRYQWLDHDEGVSAQAEVELQNAGWSRNAEGTRFCWGHASHSQMVAHKVTCCRWDCWEQFLWDDRHTVITLGAIARLREAGWRPAGDDRWACPGCSHG